MGQSSIIFGSLVLCWMFSPDALVILGNSIGRDGIFFAVPLALGLILSTMAILLLHHPAIAKCSGSSFTRLTEAIGTIPAMTLTLASRLGLVLLLPTGMLVTAGFIFNETLVYWFPNFGFSFLLLGFILVLHLAGERRALAAQPFFIGLTVGCLLLLCLAGLFDAHKTQPVPAAPGFISSEFLPSVGTALLLFVGYERQDYPAAAKNREYAIGTILGGFVLLSLWGFVSLKFVPRTTLANSTIPYTIGAREILGQSGRVVMAVAVISGTCGVVNGLFLQAGDSLQQITNRVYRTSSGANGFKRKIWPVIFAFCIGLFLTFGLAGSEHLETFIYGALLFWLLMIGTDCFAATRRLGKLQKGSLAYWYLLSAAFPSAAAWLACVHVHAAIVVVFCCLVLVVSAAISSAWAWHGRRTHNRIFNDSQGDIS